MEGDFSGGGVDEIGAKAATGAQLCFLVLLEGALLPVFGGEFCAHIAKYVNHVMAVGSKDGEAVRLSAIVDDARSVWQYLVCGDELPCADKRVRGWRLGMRRGNGECHGSHE